MAFYFYHVNRAKKRAPTLIEQKRIRMNKQGRLFYSCTKDRWEVHEVYDKLISLHRGECFEVEVGRSYLPCRIEFDQQWHVIFNQTIFHLHPETVYLVRGV